MGRYSKKGSCSLRSYSGYVRKGRGNSSGLTLRLTFRFQPRKRYILNHSWQHLSQQTCYMGSLWCKVIQTKKAKFLEKSCQRFDSCSEERHSVQQPQSSCLVPKSCHLKLGCMFMCFCNEELQGEKKNSYCMTVNKIPFL